MASVFDIFGSINLETGAFDGALQRSVGRLKAADAALDSTIARSNKLGDTSATVARRYEKLSEQIQVQRNKLLDHALAFEKGEISAKKFAQVTTSVEKATAGLTSRIKDARARLQELDDTGLTHFEQSISKAVDNANAKLQSFRQNLLAAQGGGGGTTDLFGKLSGFQKTQLSFQANDIITGLASGQNPTQILAQQGGQIFQIFQQTKTAQEGVAAATKDAALAQRVFAAESNAAAKAIAETSATTTILGYSWVGLGATVAAVGVGLLAIHTAVKDIEEAAQKRLKREEQITAEYNRQNLALADLNKRLKEGAESRAFGSFAGGDDVLGLKTGLETRQQQRSQLASEVQFKQNRYNKLLELPGLPADVLKEAFPKEAEDRLAKLDDEIVSITERLAALKQEQKNAFNSNVIDGAMRTAQAAREAVEKEAVEAAKKRKELVEKAVDDAKKFADHVKKAGEAVKGIFSSTSDNPFVRIFNDGEQAVQRMLEATKGLGSELQNTLKGLINAQTQSNAFKQSMENALKAQGLRSEAAQFLGKAAPTVSENLQKQLEAIGAGAAFSSIDYDTAGNVINKNDPNKRARDQKIIELTKGLINDEGLTPAQKQQAAGARLREAEALDKEKADLPNVLKKQNELLEKMIKEPPKLGIDIVDPANRTTIGGTSGNVNARYPQR
jgi:hypothetical protein